MPDITCLIVPSLPAASSPCKTINRAAAVGGVQPLLGHGQLSGEVVEILVGRLGAQKSAAGCLPGSQARLLSRLHSKSFPQRVTESHRRNVRERTAATIGGRWGTRTRSLL